MVFTLENQLPLREEERVFDRFAGVDEVLPLDEGVDLVAGLLRVVGRELERVPDELRVRGTERVVDRELERVPDELRVRGVERVVDRELERVPDELRVRGVERVVDRELERVPDELRVRGEFTPWDLLEGTLRVTALRVREVTSSSLER